MLQTFTIKWSRNATSQTLQEIGIFYSDVIAMTLRAWNTSQVHNLWEVCKMNW